MRSFTALLALVASALAQQTLTFGKQVVTLPAQSASVVYATATVTAAPTTTTVGVSTVTATPAPASATLYNILDQWTTPATLSLLTADGCGNAVYQQSVTPTSVGVVATITQAPSVLYATTTYTSGSSFSNVGSSCQFDTAATTIACTVSSALGVPGLTTLTLISFTTSLGSATVPLPSDVLAGSATCSATLPDSSFFSFATPVQTAVVTSTVVNVVPVTVTRRAVAWRE